MSKRISINLFQQFHRRQFFFVLLALFSSVILGQGKKPLTFDDLIQMKEAGFDEQTVISAIAANGASVDTSVRGLKALKTAGVGDKIINALLSATAPETITKGTSEKDREIPDEIGAYIVLRDTLTALPVEVVNFKTSGTISSVMTYGLKKAKFQGTVPGSKSSMQVATPVMLVLRCADGTSPTEYQLVALEAKKGGREFTEAKIGLMGASGGVNKEAISMKFEKIAKNTYRSELPNMKKGEYGILAPGALVSANGASSGKLYTFGLIE